MIDIHCHILPELDDGARNIDQSVEMARLAFADGIRTIVATPHIQPPFLAAERICLSLSILNKRLTRENIPITILAGGDVSMLLLPPDLKQYVIHKGPYILIEFPHSQLPSHAHDLLFTLSTQGFIPIITHPERNLGIIKNPRRLFDLLDLNVKVQLTSESLTGGFGKDAAECARFLLKKRMAHFLATDAHSPSFRRPVLSEGLAIAKQIIGDKAAMRLVTKNPAAVIDGKQIT
jgi:protein-tyrosine phosphatase